MLSTAIDGSGDGAVVSVNQDRDNVYSVQAALLDAGVPLLHAVYPLPPPTVTGIPRVGDTLTCRAGTWTGDPPITLTYNWLRNGDLPADRRPLPPDAR